ncbi:MAG: nuclear transport factor 2 family protein [Solirubrobacteraceae bacterium]|nr:nuclear transport factor 2 family protein [Solirubrobacteraceae bacterium]
MAELATLMLANLVEVFGERDGDRRRAAIARVHHPQVVFTDHDGEASGHAALDEAVARLHARLAPDFEFAPAGDVDLIGDLGYLAWQLGAPGQPPVVRGADIAFARDGRIGRLYVVLTGP